jgi:type IV pilus assembly protein PilN
MRIDINLATRPYEDSAQFWVRWGSGLVLLSIVTLLLISVTASGWVAARKDRRLMQNYRDQIAERDKEKSDAAALMNLPQNSSTRDRSQFLNDLFYRKAFSWTKAFESMEQVMPPGLHVVSIHPDVAVENGLLLKLIVAGESRERALELVRKMEESQRFQQTQIDQETSGAGNGSTPGDNVMFSITAVYVPEAETAATARNVH